MRRALVIAGVMLAGLLALAPAGSAAAGPVREVEFELHESGFRIVVESEFNQEKATPSLVRHGEAATYETDMELTEDTIKARFGRLGELDYTYTPPLRPGRCGEEAKGTFEGTFDFTGENGYVTFDADRATGTFFRPGSDPCRERRRAAADSRRTAAAAKPTAAAEEASLLVHTRRSLPVRSMLVFEGEESHHRIVAFTAFEQERREGMRIARGAEAVAPGRDFTWDFESGVAHVDPPAPFTGSATFERRPGGHSVWRGSLRAPLLGGHPFRLAGPEFAAQLIKGSILD